MPIFLCRASLIHLEDIPRTLHQASKILPYVTHALPAKQVEPFQPRPVSQGRCGAVSDKAWSACLTSSSRRQWLKKEGSVREPFGTGSPTCRGASVSCPPG